MLGGWVISTAAHEFVGETWVMAGGADTHHRRWQQAKEDTSAK
jgi:hypothetical protein